MATNEEIQEALEDTISENSGLKSAEVRGRKLTYQDVDKNVDSLLKMRGINSARRGLSVGRIQRPTG